MPSIGIVPFVGAFTSLLEADTRNFGLQAAVSRAVKRSGSRISVVNADYELLGSGPVLLVANHPHSAEVLALIGALPDRRDIYVVISQKFTTAGQHIGSHCIPVYLSHHHQEGRPRTVAGRVMDFFLRPARLTPEQEHELNIRSIDDAALRLNRGSLVIIFPEKRFGERRWQPGLGHLLMKLEPEVKLVFAHISGTSTADYLRIIPKAGKMLPRITVHFHEPLSIGGGGSGMHAREIVSKLEAYYMQWAASTKARS
ncbi:hypothetical protein HYY74_08230 [Candidatus Woesearchaeota archaeon]|nr:hypothetical protein [Candidatus Woesearchaeota archaeon]